MKTTFESNEFRLTVYLCPSSSLIGVTMITTVRVLTSRMCNAIFYLKDADIVNQSA